MMTATIRAISGRVSGRGRALALVFCIGAGAYASPLRGQATTDPVREPASPSCTYDRCALGIAPRWNGLALVQGTAGTQVANLNFFWPHGLAGRLAGADSSAWYAARAVRTRRVAAALLDAGGLLLGYSLVQRARTPGRGSRAMLMAGVVAVGASVPLQFAADGYLSRAVWWHNRQYVR